MLLKLVQLITLLLGVHALFVKSIYSQVPDWEVKVIFCDEVPLVTRVPVIVMCPLEGTRTVTPASIVSIAPLSTSKLLTLTLTGLSLADHVVFEEILPLTSRAKTLVGKIQRTRRIHTHFCPEVPLLKPSPTCISRIITLFCT